MRKLTLLAMAFCLCSPVFAQTPTNDDCTAAIDLGIAPTPCPGAVYSNVGATSSITGDDNPSCFNGNISERDVWFKFKCPDTLFDFRVTLTGVGANALGNLQFAVYRGDCSFGQLAEYHCAVADLGETELVYDMEGLTPGFTYFIRVTDYSATAAPKWGDFSLCVIPIPPESNIDDGGSTLCNGTLYDTGGPDGDYGKGENETFVICPTGNPACILFTLEYYNIEEANLNSDALTFYDGNSTAAPVIAILQGGTNTFTSDTLIENSGAVAFNIQATSGCLTVNFKSDSYLEFEGWKGSWTCSGAPCPPLENISLDATLSQQDIIDAVKSPSTVISNAIVNCVEGAYATFSYPTDNNDLGLQKGILLSSGSALAAQGPNSSTSTSNTFEPYFLDDPGDPDLNYLSQQQNGLESYDACILEMDVFVGSNELAFEYVFGSEEYPEYVKSNFNDIFAFLVSGPGIAGDPNIGNQQNIAILPGTNTPVQINSVNQIENWQYYRNNFYGKDLQYDGFTSDSLGVKKSLTARVPVIPCNTYHLKLAVADRGDEGWDSGVFISDIKAGAPDISSKFTGNIDHLIEQCSNGDNLVLIKLNKAATVVTTYTVTLSGSAQNGTDYTTTIPGVITFQPGETQALFNVNVLSDNIPEGTETMIISLSSDFGCGAVVLKEYIIPIKDNPEVIVSSGDSVSVCFGSNIQLSVSGANTYVWSPASLLNNPFIPTPTVLQPMQSQWFKVLGNIGICIGSDSVFVQVLNPKITVGPGVDKEICLGESTQLNVMVEPANLAVNWLPTDWIDNPSITNPFAEPEKTVTYTATVTLENCPATVSITVAVDTLFQPVVRADTALCQNYPIVLASNTNSSTSSYTWSPISGLNNPNVSNPVATPDQTTTYTLITTSKLGYCSDSKSVKISVTPADIDILGDEKRKLCLGDSVQLSTTVTPAGSPVSWSPSFYTSPFTGQSTQAYPDETTTIYATYTVNNCTVRDSVLIKVDSLPNALISKVKDKTVYCEGDTIYLISPTYEPANFPDISISWLQGPGQITPDSNWNMVLIASDTFLYKREMVNGACVDTSSVLIPVSKPPQFTLSALPNPICQGESAQINLSVTPSATQFMWKPDPSLSCTDCPNPVATPTATTAYVVTAQGVPCPAGGEISIFVESPPALNLPANVTLCLGDSLKLNDVTDPLATYSWSSVPAGYNSSNPQPTVYPVVGQTQYRVVVNGPKCSIERSVDVSVRTASINAGTDQAFCLGETITLSATPSGAAGIVLWSPTNQQGLSIEDQPTQTTIYRATLIFGNGPNCEVSDLVAATQKAGVTLSDIQFSPADNDTLCSGEKLILEVKASPDDVPVTYVWAENGINLPNANSDSIQVNTSISEGSVRYTVIASSADGCTATTNPVNFEVKRCILIPNAFTPDGDGVNDVFNLYIPSGTAIVKSLSIYNRWGQRVFQSSTAQTSWNGQMNGEQAPAEVYVWHAVVQYPDGKEETFKGDLTLLR